MSGGVAKIPYNILTHVVIVLLLSILGQGVDFRVGEQQRLGLDLQIGQARQAARLSVLELVAQRASLERQYVVQEILRLRKKKERNNVNASD